MTELVPGLFLYQYVQFIYMRTDCLVHMLQMQVRDIKVEHATSATVLK